eukprot:Rmarinus@m.11976
MTSNAKYTERRCSSTSAAAFPALLVRSVTCAICLRRTTGCTLAAEPRRLHPRKYATCLISSRDGCTQSRWLASSPSHRTLSSPPCQRRPCCRRIWENRILCFAIEQCFVIVIIVIIIIITMDITISSGSSSILLGFSRHRTLQHQKRMSKFCLFVAFGFLLEQMITAENREPRYVSIYSVMIYSPYGRADSLDETWPFYYLILCVNLSVFVYVCVCTCVCVCVCV